MPNINTQEQIIASNIARTQIQKWLIIENQKKKIISV
jgi:hypothetical protein